MDELKCECGHDEIHHLSFGDTRARRQDCDVTNCTCKVWTPVVAKYGVLPLAEIRRALDQMLHNVEQIEDAQEPWGWALVGGDGEIQTQYSYEPDNDTVKEWEDALGRSLSVVPFYKAPCLR